MKVAAETAEIVAEAVAAVVKVAVEIAENAYLESPQSVLETEEKLRQLGLRVIMDGFNGDYISLSTIDKLSVGTLADYYAALEDKKPGDTVAVTVYRKGKYVKINVTLEGEQAASGSGKSYSF